MNLQLFQNLELHHLCTPPMNKSNDGEWKKLQQGLSFWSLSCSVHPRFPQKHPKVMDASALRCKVTANLCPPAAQWAPTHPNCPSRGVLRKTLRWEARESWVVAAQFASSTLFSRAGTCILVLTKNHGLNVAAGEGVRNFKWFRLVLAGIIIRGQTHDKHQVSKRTGLSSNIQGNNLR